MSAIFTMTQTKLDFTNPTSEARTVDPEQPNWDLLNYRMYRKNAIWFSARTDDYENGLDHKHVVIPKGHSRKCAESWLAKCEELSRLPSVRDVALGHISSTGGTSAANAVLNPEVNCLCLDCARKEVERILTEHGK